ncbi:MAG: hypothetical protein UW46_C0003G0019 [Candidatus Yanofskybacteria bacterium GW2011_GWF1_44_227]|uniref:Uncharacterized protein n=1 Tax=Candidatus Yanofskybacteria bacterium GW2011_GWE2_40_11 TaxID=1619033 RepID=A0A0G0QLB1_9BACT|nr:MAG: hypothetical protein UT69_C0008G0038 [Candidatus Yanofskybacteria bacterium GW2011_GWE1_40_10]KKR41209.1 MAG: hypothetical protein UT75_C0001G0113 [Candidatus Yanofskybacteria bacterium GW2011_GWE2_40_11]KKT15714.1 MAG: hypothetical protein UV97_C0003G0046 [Candidatus Yanofskybacteria bacterium GW2011_GWF2_43_596]KKT53398.1 MAG: hypothetical protein UW46_C0003G0019 [Candidatus Yanofskybacteria bacterium GW2011_GWF1_44_227]OGN36189.1 MAG: hypothetical protein A2241_00375 [Candidatus Yano
MSQERLKIYGIELRWIIVSIGWLIMCGIMYPDMKAIMPLWAFIIAMLLGAFWGWLLIVLALNPVLAFMKKTLTNALRVDVDDRP